MILILISFIVQILKKIYPLHLLDGTAVFYFDIILRGYFQLNTLYTYYSNHPLRPMLFSCDVDVLEHFIRLITNTPESLTVSDWYVQGNVCIWHVLYTSVAFEWRPSVERLLFILDDGCQWFSSSRVGAIRHLSP